MVKINKKHDSVYHINSNGVDFVFVAVAIPDEDYFIFDEERLFLESDKEKTNIFDIVSDDVIEDIEIKADYQEKHRKEFRD